MQDRYNPKEVEGRIYKWWEDSGFFKAEDKSTKRPFAIILPPPNVTGFLHIGHALDTSIQDCLIRWKRMRGFNALWLPGTDHAGISTQSVVEKDLKKQNITRHQLGREAFVQKVWEWKGIYGNRIYSQLRGLGHSLDWDRACFTLDENVSKAVRKVFVTLFKKGLIYRGQKLVNWSPPLETAVSDLEVEHKEIKGKLYYIKYLLDEDPSLHLLVATTRPETLFGDVAVAVNPEDERYSKFIGKKLRLPLTDRLIPVIGDNYVDMTFGTGALKITPAHDFNDYKIGKTHKLPLVNILTPKGELNEWAGAYAGLKTVEARKKVLEDLKTQTLLEKEEPYTHSVGHCERTGAVIEPYLSDQWFMKMEGLAIPAKHVVETGSIRIEPESWVKVYLHWLNNIEDWCVSRQLWWGHRIPAWKCQDCGQYTVEEIDPAQCSHCQSTKIEQESDVLDTWFSSALWPFSTLGWPKDTEALKTFYPTDVLVTGHDILFFWVARMILMGLEFQKDVPFRTVYLHGLVRDSQGRKMSKSLGNSIDPLEMQDKYGTDALRFTLLSQLYAGKDLKFSEQKAEGYRNFMNKIWNAARYVLMSGKIDASMDLSQDPPFQAKDLTVYDQWIISSLEKLTIKVDEAMEAYRFSDAAHALYHFIWNQFCDWYIEFTKGQNSLQVAAYVLHRWLRLLHPFCPFITEEIFDRINKNGTACMISDFPTVDNQKKLFQLGSQSSCDRVDLLIEIISNLRNIRGENRIKPSEKINVFLEVSSVDLMKAVQVDQNTIKDLSRIDKLEIVLKGAPDLKSAVSVATFKDQTIKIIVPLEGLVDLAEEIQRITKLLEKTQQEAVALESRLNNENFIKRADPEVVAADKEIYQDLKRRLELLTQARSRFQ